MTLKFLFQSPASIEPEESTQMYMDHLPVSGQNSERREWPALALC